MTAVEGTGEASGAAVDLDLQLRVELTHAAVQAIADREGLHLLHVKGPALDTSLSHPGRTSSDADVLVRPEHVAAFVAALPRHGFRLVTGFASGSAFEHAANHHSQAWGYVDVHRTFPGVTVAASTAFESLWAARSSVDLAHRPCPVPQVLDQALLLTLHGARAEGSERGRLDIERAFTSTSPERQARLRERAAELGATLALAAALDELDQHRDDPAHDLWLYYSRGGTRLQEWRARLKAAPTLGAKARVLGRGIGVNREYLAMELGHDPSRRELAREFVDRYRTAARSLRPRRDAS